jgi:hypothetical protein
MEPYVMKKTQLSILGGVVVVVLGLASGCGGGGGSSHSAGGGSGGGNNDTVEGISTPSSVSVVTAQNVDQVQ